MKEAFEIIGIEEKDQMWHTHEYDSEYSYPRNTDKAVYLTKDQFKCFMIYLGFLKDKKGNRLSHSNFVMGSFENCSNYFSSFRQSPVKSPQLESIEQRIQKLERQQFESCYEMLLRKKVEQLSLEE